MATVKKKNTTKVVTKSRTTKVTKQRKGKNAKGDKAKKALQPGFRVSKFGNVYFEDRKNRSDVNPDKKL